MIQNKKNTKTKPQKQEKSKAKAVTKKKLPLVTIVTPLYNSAWCLEKTIESVLSQSYKNIEFIIVDGGSTDGSLELIKKYGKKISRVISEPDKGAYDAMNKGAKIAKGEWINFMNAGDWFVSDTVISDIFNEIDLTNTDFVYGNTESRSNNNKIFSSIEDSKITDIWIDFRLCAQSLFMKTSVARNLGFDLAYPIQAYYDFLIRAVQTGYRFKKVALVVASYMGGGMSAQNPFREIYSRWEIARKLLNNPFLSVHFIWWTIKKTIAAGPKRVIEKLTRK